MVLACLCISSCILSVFAKNILLHLYSTMCNQYYLTMDFKDETNQVLQCCKILITLCVSVVLFDFLHHYLHYLKQLYYLQLGIQDTHVKVHVGLSYFRELITVLGTSEDDIDDITGCTTLMPISPPMMQGLGFDALYAYSYSYID